MWNLKQLDELETRFVQLTNDKAELMNRLDAEQFANREMQTNYNAMEERLRTFDERFKFKDEEMIRLSHENEELKKKLEHSHSISKNIIKIVITSKTIYDGDNHTNAEQQNCEPAHTHTNEPELCVEATEQNSPGPTNRFTTMTQCADLTEEKQRLEHLVMQLQSETETIGEYIALYQTQRRILKQREYERPAQTAMLQAEREQMRERLTMLNNLVSSLGMKMPQNQELNQHINEALAQNIALNVTNLHNESSEHSFTDSSMDSVATQILQQI
ncbi:Golgin subfamily A member 2 [Eumeta japonica]|uniref:Golgin subfamily A member 2 n=1 Tax=Eumeta variegata TaxID=151549 RepID=A0A4C1TKP9_EUMVA|nr:Golgin subfamily A member 2 [Eumeta japonica]